MTESTQLVKTHITVPSSAENTAMIDGLSNLPDDVICHILSFLPTQEACRTAVLSSRWKLLWTMVPDLDFHFPMWASTAKRDGFVNSIYAALLQRTVEGIRKFNLSGELHCAPYHVSTWVRRAIRCNVEELCLDVRPYPATCLPREIFTCESLRVLKLRGNIRLGFPPYVIKLPLLKILDLALANWEIRDGDVFFRTFLSGCWLLEELHMSGDFKFSIHISVPTLKKLKLHSFQGPVINSLKIVINTPSLEVLDLQDWHFDYFRIYEMTNVRNVARATLCIRTNHYTADLFMLFKHLSNVKWLSLSSDTIGYLSDGGVDNLSLPLFHNLAYLRVELSQNCSWDMLLSFLQNAVNLEILVIEKKFKKSIVSAELGHSWTELPNIPWCLFTTFKMFEFSGISVRADLGFVQYIIQSSSKLEKIKLFIAKSMTQSKSLIERILQIRRESSRAIRWVIQCEAD